MAAPDDPRSVVLSSTVYRFLLAAYPRRFRRAYREEMTLIFRDCARESYRSKGRPGVARLWTRALLDLLHNVPKEFILSLVRKDAARAYETLSCSACYSVIEREWMVCNVCGEFLTQETVHVTRNQVPGSSLAIYWTGAVPPDPTDRDRD